MGIRGEGPSTVYCPQSNTRTTRALGRGELSPSKLTTIQYTVDSTIQSAVLRENHLFYCIVVSTRQYNSLYDALYLEGLLTITFSLPRSDHFLTTFTFSSLQYHFLATVRLEFPPSLFEHFFGVFFLCYADFSRLFATSQ